jgi:ATP synthase F1 epsilon subunit
MLTRVAARSASIVGRRRFATETATNKAGETDRKATKVKLAFATPYEVVKVGEVDSVVIPGASGVFTASANSAATISQMQPGLLRIKDGQTETKYIVSGGFAIVRRDSSVAVSAAEAVALEDVDVEAAKAYMTQAQAKMNSASNEQEKAIARIQFETAQQIVRVASNTK